MTLPVERSEAPSPRRIMTNSILIEEPESLSPGTNPTRPPETSDADTSCKFPSPRQHRTNTSKRLSGRPAPNPTSTPSLQSVSSVSGQASTYRSAQTNPESKTDGSNPHVRRPERASHIVSQVAEWLQHEKAKQAARNSMRHKGRVRLAHAAEATKALAHSLHHDETRHQVTRDRRSSSDLSDDGIALEKLEQILASSMDLDGGNSTTPTEDKTDSCVPRRKSTHKGSKHVLTKKSTGAMSDSESREDEILVPSAEVVLDCSKALGYSGGVVSSGVDLLYPTKRAIKEREDWRQFKCEIVRLTHTLKIPGWRRVPIVDGGEVDVERLSGALTNAVYVVSPPKDLSDTAVAQGSAASLLPKKPPRKLLLRIYGPQVEHLIDREGELQILRRLGRKQIGPRLLGTFINGRFEQFFHARTLTFQDLRIPETSKQIAKRMRELHDGIELLEEERDGGAFVWRNWDKWVERCEEVISWLDAQILANKQGSARSKAEEWKDRGLICGVEWSVFRRTVQEYRNWLQGQYGGPTGIRQKLVFAHNDTQYGNLLRLEPGGESPLLLPSNEHKQLIVIDFEYASANVPGLEFANHFTEWCYDYHDTVKPYALRERWYPTIEEQHRFLKAYVQHNPPIRPAATPKQSSCQGPTGSVSAFVLDSRAPPLQYAEDESRREEALQTEIKRLQHETRMWRIANSAQWVAWGIVQANVAGMDEALQHQKSGTTTPKSLSIADDDHPHSGPDSNPLGAPMATLALDDQSKRAEGSEAAEEAQEEGNDEEEFDYLGYAQERAMFFWGDVLQLGIVKREDLPAELLKKAKIVDY